jgi:hypothetical protein
MNEPMRIIRTPVPRSELAALAQEGFGDLVKAVVDTERRIMAIAAELHADEEAALLEDGSAQADLWGINLYPDEAGEGWIEFDSMINVRPRQGNRSRSVDDPEIRAKIAEIVGELLTEA